MRIFHVLGMVIGYALGFALYRDLTVGLQPSWKPFGHLYVVVMGGAVGVLLGGGLALARQARQGDARAMSQPGHWLLAFGLACLLANAGAVAAFYGWYHDTGVKEEIRPPFWMPFREGWAPTAPGIIHQAVCWGLAGTAALVISVASWHRLPWSWRAFFLAILLCATFMCAGYIAAFVDFWGRTAAIAWCRRAPHLYAKVIVICSLIVVLAIVRDFRHERRGDFLHWTGILVWSVIAAMQLALYFNYTLGRMPLSQYIGILLSW
jgi:hypothetical protein